jgi:hypothetical protein
MGGNGSAPLIAWLVAFKEFRSPGRHSTDLPTLGEALDLDAIQCMRKVPLANGIFADYWSFSIDFSPGWDGLLF